MMKRILREWLLCAALAVLLCTALTPGAARAESDGMLRVKLTRLGASASVTLDADCTLAPSMDGAHAIPLGTPVTVTASDGRLTLQAGDQTLDAGAALLLRRVAGEGCGVRFTAPALANRFCGDLVLTASGGAVSAVLNIFVEDYLCGLVGYEMPPSAGEEALKAQAVAARSYALYQKAGGVGDYDLTDTAGGFTFKGLSDGEDYAAAIQAVNDTRGQVLWYGEGVACGYCTESNGGQTESAANAFGSAAAYTAVSDDAYDDEGGGTKKSAALPANAANLPEPLAQLLNDAAARALTQAAGGEVQNVRVTAITDAAPESPRFAGPSRLYTAVRLDLQAEGVNAMGNAVTTQLSVSVPTYGGLEAWYGLSINDADNETVWVDREADGFSVTFRRSGHGVGMSQRGALAMAGQHQMTYDAILAYYFPGTRLETLDLAAREVAPVETAAPVQPALPVIAEARAQERTALLSAPDAGAEPTANLAAGAAVEIYGAQDGWISAGSSGKTGYVDMSALSGVELTGEDVVRPDVPESAAMQAAAPLLELPLDDARILRQLDAGEAVTVSARSSRWVEVTTAMNESGFVRADALAGGTAADAPAETLGAPETLAPAETPEPQPTEEPDDPLPEDMVRSAEGDYAKLTETGTLYAGINDVQVRAILERGRTVKILAKNDQWAYVLLKEGTKGFVQKNVLKEFTVEATPEPTQDAGKGDGGSTGNGRPAITGDGGRFKRVSGARFVYVQADTALLYESNAEDSNVLANLSIGQRVQVGAYNKKWAYVSADGQLGFALISGLSPSKPKATPTPAPTPEAEAWAAGAEADGALAGMAGDVAALPDDSAVETEAPQPAATEAPRPSGPEGGAVKRPKGRKVVAVQSNVAAMYKSWSTDSPQVAWLEKGAKVQVLAYNSVWAYVSNGSAMGYIQMAALTGSGGSTSAEVGVEAVTVIDLKLYRDETMTGTGLATVPQGAVVRVLNYSGQSVYVEYSGQRGYLPAGYLQKR